MKTITLTKRAKVNPRKHVMFGEASEGYLFVIRHLVPVKKRMTGFKTLYKKENVKVCDLQFHVSEETFKIMMALYLFKDLPELPESMEIIPKFHEK